MVLQVGCFAGGLHSVVRFLVPPEKEDGRSPRGQLKCNNNEENTKMLRIY